MCSPAGLEHFRCSTCCQLRSPFRLCRCRVPDWDRYRPERQRRRCCSRWDAHARGNVALTEADVRPGLAGVGRPVDSFPGRMLPRCAFVLYVNYIWIGLAHLIRRDARRSDLAASVTGCQVVPASVAFTAHRRSRRGEIGPARHVAPPRRWSACRGDRQPGEPRQRTVSLAVGCCAHLAGRCQRAVRMSPRTKCSGKVHVVECCSISTCRRSSVRPPLRSPHRSYIAELAALSSARTERSVRPPDFHNAQREVRTRTRSPAPLRVPAPGACTTGGPRSPGSPYPARRRRGAPTDPSHPRSPAGTGPSRSPRAPQVQHPHALQTVAPERNTPRHSPTASSSSPVLRIRSRFSRGPETLTLGVGASTMASASC